MAMVIDEVFDLLKSIKAVESESEFARDWLGRSECYLRTMRFNCSEPSVATIAICASKLHHYGRILLGQSQHRWIGERFLTLSEQCHQQINLKSRSTWLKDLRARDTATAALNG